LEELQAQLGNIDDDLSAPADHDWQEAVVEAAGDEVLEEFGDVSLDEIAQFIKALAKIVLPPMRPASFFAIMRSSD